MREGSDGMRDSLSKGTAYPSVFDTASTSSTSLYDRCEGSTQSVRRPSRLQTRLMMSSRTESRYRAVLSLTLMLPNTSRNM